jgi:uncharacterized protein YeaO (DUF488 family)
MSILVKRVYAPADEGDGFRILVDRLWPRGLTKGAARVDLWLKDVAPSDGLRRWFGHDAEKWSEFRARYAAELAAAPEALDILRRAHAEHGHVTLLFAAKDEAHNNAVVLRDALVTPPRSPR